MIYETNTSTIGQTATTDPTPHREPLAIPTDSPAKPHVSTSALPPPAPFRNPQSEIRNFPALPPFLHALTTEICSDTDTPLEFTATACLGVLSAAIGAGTELRERGRHIRPNLYTALLSPSDPDYATAFAQAHEPLSFEQVIIETNWESCILPRLRLERESLIHARSVARRNRNHDDTSRHHELTEIERDLESIRKTHEQRPVLFVSSLTRQRLVQRLARHDGQTLSILTTDPTDIAPILGHRSSPTPGQTALTENILLEHFK